MNSIFSLRVILLSITLTLLLAISNTYLALKAGILTSASIPAAMISMGVLRFFKNSSIHENNLVQTMASAGEAVAGGIVYTIPALIMIRYWQHFSYWENFFIALTGGALGVFFSIPLRRTLMHEKTLRFPEGKAIAEILKSSEQAQFSLKYLLSGGMVGALIEFAQSGLKLLSSYWPLWFSSQRMIFGFGIGFSTTLMGAGFLIGFDTCASIFLGALLSWGIGIPVTSYFYPVKTNTAMPIVNVVSDLWWEHLSYIGITAMLLAGFYTIFLLLKPLYRSMRFSLHIDLQTQKEALPAKEQDIALRYVILGIVLTLVLSFFVLKALFPLHLFPYMAQHPVIFLLGTLLYISVIGFIFCTITGYFSGLVGVSASPGSAIVIAGLLLSTFLLQHLFGAHAQAEQSLGIQAIAIIIVSVLTGAAAIANDNIQDLKVGQIIGTPPWQQQIMLLFGVITSALIIPPVMEVLFQVYGIGDVLPRLDMDKSLALPVPPAAAMAHLTQAVLQHQIPSFALLIGAVIILACILLKSLSQLLRCRLSILGLAIGFYLPLASSVPLFIGGVFALLANSASSQHADHSRNHMVLLACGLIVGSVLMDVILAIPFSLAQDPNFLRLLPPQWQILSSLLSVVMTIILGIWFYRLRPKK